MTKTSEFNDVVLGELLLYTKEEFTKEEAIIIANSLKHRMLQNKFYIGLIYDVIPKIECKIFPKLEDDELTEERHCVYQCVKRARSKSIKDIEDELGHGLFFMAFDYGIPIPSNYLQAIYDNVIDARIIEEVLSSDINENKFKPDHKFLVTSNMLMIREPLFYTKEFMKKLSKLINNASKKDFDSKEDYKKYKIAATVCKKNIKKYNKVLNSENKVLKKVKK